nr:FtsK/SpoIIIE domain-containing protein [Streptomyces sp. HPF1205]
MLAVLVRLPLADQRFYVDAPARGRGGALRRCPGRAEGTADEMQIRLTVLGPRGGRTARGCDVLVTAPAGTALSAVAGALASAAGSGQPGGRSSSVALYAGGQRLAPSAVLGTPPLVDGALLSLHAPAGQVGEAPDGDHGQYGRFGQYGRPPAELARLHVVGGPDAGGVHLLPGGQARIGRSADADVPLDDPDVSRLHCEVAVGADGTVTVMDLGSTNGTALAGRPVGPRPEPFPAGSLLRIGESTLRLDAGGPASSPPSLPTQPDGDGHLRVAVRDGARGSVPQEVPPAGRQDGSPGAAPRAGASPAGPRTTAGDAAAGQHADAGSAWDVQRPFGAPGRSPEGAGASDAPPPAPSAAPSAPAAPPAAPAVPAPRPAAGTPAAERADAEPSPYSPGAHDTFGRGLPAEARRRATGERERRAAGRGAGTAAGGEARGGVVGSIGAWARRRLSGGGPRVEEGPADGGLEAEVLRERWPDPSAVLLTALGPGRRLWERGVDHPDAMTVRLGTADLPSQDGRRRLPGVPFTIDLRAPRTAALTLAGPRPRLSGLARAVLAHLCALHSPGALEVVLVSADRTRSADQRAEEWSWLNWLPHLRPVHGQDCRLLLAFDREQAEARAAELVRRVEAGPLGPGWPGAAEDLVAAAAVAYDGPFTVLVVDGDPGSAQVREAVDRLAFAGPSAGVHVLCLAEAGERPAVSTGVVARLSGDVATTLRLESAGGDGPREGAPEDSGEDADGGDWYEEVVLDAVSAAWAEHFARALAPLREADGEAGPARSRHALPAAVRLLDELDLALATPARIGSRWAQAPAAVPGAGAVLGVGPGGRVGVDLVAEGPHLLIGGAPGSGKTELLRSLAAGLAAGERPERLALVLVDGAGQEHGEGLLACADLPHVSAHLVASDPVRMREFAQALTAELKRRAEVLGGRSFAAWHAERVVTAAVPRQGAPGARPAEGRGPSASAPGQRQRQSAVPRAALPRLVVVVDDFDALVAPGLGSPGRPSAGSVVRALEAVARDGEALGVHLVAATGRPERTTGTDADGQARLRISLRAQDPESAALVVHVEDPAALDDLPGRGYLRRPGGAVTVFQAARVSARIPRTATLRPTVVPLEWERMGDPPTRRPLRELGNGPTDLALLASALQRAAAPDDPAAAPAAFTLPSV